MAREASKVQLNQTETLPTRWHQPLEVPTGKTRTVDVVLDAPAGHDVYDGRGAYAEMSDKECYEQALIDLGSDHPATTHFGILCGARIAVPKPRINRQRDWQRKLF